jgi:GNAT superfamily N-acetyltransferase
VGSAVVVREASVGDARRIAELLSYGSLHPDVEDPENAKAYATVIEAAMSGRSVVLVAELDGEVVGVLQVLVLQHLKRQGGLCAELESVHVHRDHRGGGIGGVLVEAAVERARDLGCYQVQLTSNLKRPEAHRFYEAHGFDASHVGFKRYLAR